MFLFLKEKRKKERKNSKFILFFWKKKILEGSAAENRDAYLEEDGVERLTFDLTPDGFIDASAESDAAQVSIILI